MEYLLLFITKYVFGYFLQDIIVILGIHTFSKQKIEKRTYILILYMLVPTNIIVRILPMSYGIHTLLNVAIILFATYKFSSLQLYDIIRSTLITTLLVLSNEVFCFVTLLFLFGQAKADSILQQPLLKATIYIPFNLILGLIILLFYKRMVKKYY